MINALTHSYYFFAKKVYAKYKEMCSVFAVLLSIVIFVAVEAVDIPSCHDVSYGTACTGMIPTRLTIAGDLLIVGGNNSLCSFHTLPRLKLKECVSLEPNSDTIRNCKSAIQSTECYNLVRILQPIPPAAVATLDNASIEEMYNDTILVCGTNAFSPKCTIHARTNLSEQTDLSARIEEGFSPYSVSSRNIGLLASDGKFYTGTDFGRFSKSYRVSVALHPLKGNISFIVSTPTNSPIWLTVANTKFISLYEIGDHIYIFAKEPAYEVNEGSTKVYSRVMRFCKSDLGLDESVFQFRRFRTFQKARITCPHRPLTSVPTFFFDNIISTYLYWPSDSTLPTLYAAFSSSVNGPESVAVCKFSFSGNENINSLFGNSRYYITDGNNALRIESELLYVCPGKTGRQRTDAEARNHQLAIGIERTDAEAQLAIGSVLPVGGVAMTTSDGQTFTSIAVDAFSYNHTSYEIIYVGTSGGFIKALLFSNGSLSGTFDFLSPDSQESPSSITQLILTISNQTQIRRLYGTTDKFFVDIALGNCSKYVTCVECLESSDPYCAWLDNSCINKLLHTQTTTGISEAIKPPVDIIKFCGVSSPSLTSSDIILASSTSSIIKSTTTTTKSSLTTSTAITERTPSSSQMTSSLKEPSSTQSQINLLTSNSLSTLSVTPTVGSINTTSNSKLVIAETAGALAGGVFLGFVAGTILCFIAFVVGNKFMKKRKDQVITNPHNNAARPRQRQGSVGHYAITVDFPKGDEENEKMPNGMNLSPDGGDLSPPSPIVTIDSDLEDDAISDLPSHYQRHNKRSIPKGRTESTTWLRAESESEAD